jgi:hypothetical protein
MIPLSIKNAGILNKENKINKFGFILLLEATKKSWNTV